MEKAKSGLSREWLERYINILIAISLIISIPIPIFLSSEASAAQLSSRKVTISTSQPDFDGVTYDFTFTSGTSSPIQSMVFEFCSTALSTCVLPGTDATPLNTEKMDVSHVTASTPTGNFTGTTNTDFVEYTGASAGACTGAGGGSGVATMYCVNRTEATTEVPGVKTFRIENISNPIIPSGNNEEIYVRISTYSDTAFATPIDSGTVAASIIRQLTATGRVQERLIFCVFALDDAAGSSSTVGTGDAMLPTDCTANEANASTSVDIGVVDNLTIQYSPEDNAPPSNLGNDRFGAALVNTNASSGVTISYFASPDSAGTNELRAFRVPGATCDASGTSVVDQCFVSADDTTGETLVAGTERFGMQIACVANSTTAAGIGTTSNLGKNGSGVYVNGDGTGGSYNSIYNAGRTTGIDDDPVADDCENETTITLDDKFAWRDSATSQAIISSASVIDDELLKLRFGATANATTPTGTYTVASTFIATPTF